MKKLMKKKFMITVLSLVLMTSLTVTGTLAFTYSATAVQKENVFTFTAGDLYIAIYETLFGEFTGDTYAYQFDLFDPEGDNVVEKDPMIKNLSPNGEEIFTAMRLVWVWNDGGSGDPVEMSLADYDKYIAPYVTLDDLAENTGGSGDWAADADSYTAAVGATGVYYYKDAVAFNGETGTLFDYFIIDIDENDVRSEIADGDTMTVLQKWNSMGGFTIRIEASAVDKAFYPTPVYTEAIDELFGLFGLSRGI